MTDKERREFMRLLVLFLLIGVLGGYLGGFVYHPQVQQLAESRSFLLSQVSSLENTVFSLKKEVVMLSADKEKLQNDVQKLRLDLHDARGALAAARGQIFGLEEEISELNKRLPKPLVETQARINRTATSNQITISIKNTSGQTVTEVQLFLLVVHQDTSITFDRGYGYRQVSEISAANTVTIKLSLPAGADTYLILVVAGEVATITKAA